VPLQSAQKGLEDIADHAEVPGWMRSLPDEIVWSITSTLHGACRCSARRRRRGVQGRCRPQGSGTPRPH